MRLTDAEIRELITPAAWLASTAANVHAGRCECCGFDQELEPLPCEHECIACAVAM